MQKKLGQVIVFGDIVQVSKMKLTYANYQSEDNLFLLIIVVSREVRKVFDDYSRSIGNR